MSEIGTDCFVPFVRDVEEGRREERKRKEGRQEGRSGGQFVCVCACACACPMMCTYFGHLKSMRNCDKNKTVCSYPDYLQNYDKD